VTEQFIRDHLPEIRQGVEQHQLTVKTLTGLPVSLGTFEAAPLPPSKPLPHPPLDSAKNDKNEGIGYNVPPNPTGTPRDAAVPALLKRTSLLAESKAEPAKPKPAEPQRRPPQKGKRGHS
jgi:hypothetical protein